MFDWAHYGKSPDNRRTEKGKGKGKGKGVRRSEHLVRLFAEFPGQDIGERGIKATMRRELMAVEAAIRVRLAFGGSINEVDRLEIIPKDTPGKLQGQALVDCSRHRGFFEVTALMWATRLGIRWVELMVRFGADVNQVTSTGWTAALFGAAFQSRDVVMDGATDSTESYGGYRSRSRGVLGPLLDNGVLMEPALPLEEFLRGFGPTPITAGLVHGGMVGPLDIAVIEGGTMQQWSNDLRSLPRMAQHAR